MKTQLTIFSAVLTLSFFSIGCNDKAKFNASGDKVSKELEDERKALADKIANGGEVTNEDFDAIIESNKSKAKELEAMGGNEAVAGKIMAAINKDQGTLMENLDTSLIEEGMDYDALYTKKDYDARIAQIEKYEKFNQEALAYAKENKAVKTAEEILNKEKVSSSDKADFMKGMTDSVSKSVPHLITIRNCDTELTKIAIDVLKLLKKEDGEWSVENGSVLLNNEKALNQFNESMESIQEIAQKQADAQVKLLR